MKTYAFITGSILLVLATCAPGTRAQNFTATGGRALGLAGSSILLTDAYGLFNNPGATKVQSLSFIGAYHTQYLNLGLNDARLGIVMPIGQFTTGLGVMYYGDKLFNQMQISGLLVDEIGFARISLRGNYHQYYVQGYGYRSALTLDIGGVFTLSRQLSLAMVFQNLTRSGLWGEASSPLNSLMQIGLSYQPAAQFRLDMQLEKTIADPVGFRLGMEYQINETLSARTGFSPTASLAALGLGISWKNFTLDLAGNYQQQLGYSGVVAILIHKQVR